MLAERPPPASTPVAPQPPVANPSAGVSLREGITASAAEQALAKQIKAAGWEYVMPRPKSARARWGNSDSRTTWWNGYWKNSKTGRYSTSQPATSDGFKGDGIENTGWRRGGSPGAPPRIEWLCSTSGGIPPRGLAAVLRGERRNQSETDTRGYCGHMPAMGCNGDDALSDQKSPTSNATTTAPIGRRPWCSRYEHPIRHRRRGPKRHHFRMWRHQRLRAPSVSGPITG